MLRSSVWRVVSGALLLVLVVAGSAYVAVACSVGRSIRSTCADALQAHPGDRIDALAAVLHSDNADLRSKNRAAWTLGEIRDSRALPSLEQLVTNDGCHHRRQVCQYEVRKAAKKINGDIPDPYPWKW